METLDFHETTWRIISMMLGSVGVIFTNKTKDFFFSLNFNSTVRWSWRSLSLILLTTTSLYMYVDHYKLVVELANDQTWRPAIFIDFFLCISIQNSVFVVNVEQVSSMAKQFSQATNMQKLEQCQRVHYVFEILSLNRHYSTVMPRLLQERIGMSIQYLRNKI